MPNEGVFGRARGVLSTMGERHALILGAVLGAVFALQPTFLVRLAVAAVLVIGLTSVRFMDEIDEEPWYALGESALAYLGLWAVGAVESCVT